MSAATETIITSNLNSSVPDITRIKIAEEKPKKKRRVIKRRPSRMSIKAVFFDLYGVYIKYINNEAAMGIISKSKAFTIII